MSSLALLAHEARKPPAFNGLLYGTIATVIPVLFLAIAVQGTAYESLLTGGVNAFAQAVNMPDKDEYTGHELRIGFGRMGLFAGAILAAVGIVVVAIVGEIQALIALDAQHAEGWPLPATIILIVTVVVVVPDALLARSLRAWYRLPAAESVAELRAKAAAIVAEMAKIAEERKAVDAALAAAFAAALADPKEPGTPPAGPETSQPSEPDTPRPKSNRSLVLMRIGMCAARRQGLETDPHAKPGRPRS